MVEKSDKTPEGVEYKYFKCNKCGEEIVDMKQLHNVVEKYRIKPEKDVAEKFWGSKADNVWDKI